MGRTYTPEQKEAIKLRKKEWYEKNKEETRKRHLEYYHNVIKPRNQELKELRAFYEAHQQIQASS